MEWTEIIGRLMQYAACFALGVTFASNRVYRQRSEQDGKHE